MKKILLTIISVLIILFSSVLIYHVFSEDSIEINQGVEKEDSTDDVMNEIDENLIDENDEVKIGEIVWFGEEEEKKWLEK